MIKKIFNKKVIIFLISFFSVCIFSLRFNFNSFINDRLGVSSLFVILLFAICFLICYFDKWDKKNLKSLIFVEIIVLLLFLVINYSALFNDKVLLLFLLLKIINVMFFGYLINNFLIYCSKNKKNVKDYISSMFKNKRNVICSLIFAIIISLMESIGSYLLSNDMFLGDMQIISLLLLIVKFAILTFLFTIFILFIVKIMNNLNRFTYKIPMKYYIFIFISFLLVWGMYYLIYYPGVLSPDSIKQIGQAMGDLTLSNHHPIFHTYFIKLCILIGGNVFRGVVIYSVVQMILLSLSFTYILFYLNKKSINLYVILFSYLILLLSPINALYSFTMWKDIPFGIVMLFLVINMLEMASNKNYVNNWKNLLFLFINLLLVMLFRNNGLYILILMIPVILILFKKKFLKVLIIWIFSIIVFILFQSFIFNSLGVVKGSKREMLSVPLQQIARVVKYHKEDLSEGQLLMINKYLDVNTIGDNYLSYISDPVKATFKDGNFDEDKMGFIKVWFDLLKQYPGDCIDSFLYGSYGYWTPEVTYWSVFTSISNNSYDLKTSGLIDFPYNMKKLVTGIRLIPCVSLIFSIGFNFWLNGFMMLIIVLKKRYKLLLPGFLLFFLWLTVVASPVYAEFRYVYPIVLVFPILLALVVDNDKFKYNA